jgi:hypothetical protein
MLSKSITTLFDNRLQRTVRAAARRGTAGSGGS